MTGPLVRGAAVADPQPLVVEGLSRRFGGLVALRGVSFEAAAGRITALIGPNGAGKTTAFNCITGIDRPDAGRVRLGRVRLDGRPAHEIAGLGVARTFQTLQVFTTLSVLENVLVPAEQRAGRGVTAALRLPAGRRAEATARARARACLEAAGLAALADRPAAALGFGEQRRLEVARALALEPRLLLLDEPASGLPRAEVAELAALLRRLRDDGLTILLIEHDVATVMAVADHVVVLDRGEVIAAGPPEAVRRDPRVIEAYLGTGEGAGAGAPDGASGPGEGGAARPSGPPPAVAGEAAALVEAVRDARAAAAGPAGARLELRGLAAARGDLVVLRGVDLDVLPGRITALVGANGAGKSTLLAAAAGLLPATGGCVRLGATDLTPLPAERRAALGLALVPERRQLWARLTVLEHLLLGAYLATGGLLGTGAARRRLAPRLAAVERLFPRLTERRDQLAGTLSGGEQQMLAIARGLMAGPRCLMLDEPSLGLAPLVVAEILRVLAELARAGLAVLLVEQNARAALSAADHAAVLERGQIVLAGSPAALAADARVRAAYLGG